MKLRLNKNQIEFMLNHYLKTNTKSINVLIHVIELGLKVKRLN